MARCFEVRRHLPYVRGVPDLGYAFTNRNPVEVFTLTSVIWDTITDPGTVITNISISVILSPVPQFIASQPLRFTMQAEELLYSSNGNTLTRSFGWQATLCP